MTKKIEILDLINLPQISIYSEFVLKSLIWRAFLDPVSYKRVELRLLLNQRTINHLCENGHLIFLRSTSPILTSLYLIL